MTPEHKLMNEIRIYSGEQGFISLRLNSGKARQGIIKNSSLGLILTKLKAVELCPKGTSDLLIIMPNKIAFIETKVHPYKPTQEQLNFINQIKKLGHIAGVVYSLEEFKNLIKKGTPN